MSSAFRFATALYLQTILVAVALAQSSVVISQVYGGGGNSGARLRNDFVELFNRGTATAEISGWSIQYASAMGSSWDATSLSGSVQPGQYYLVQLGQGAGGSESLPTPDAMGGLNLSATTGKIALVRDGTRLTGTAPSGNIADVVGYGDANFSEGRPAPELSNTLAALRIGNGCTDTQDNRSDFITREPAPRNTASPRSLCSLMLPEISSTGVTSAASFRSGAIAPGEIITIFGSAMGPQALVGTQLTSDQQFVTKTLGGTRVLFNGVTAAMIYSQARQVSAVVPYVVGGRTTIQMQVEYEGRLSNTITLDVAPTAPAIFTQDASGRGLGSILNQDGRVNSPALPATKGTIIVIYGTGAGETVPAGEDGRIVSAAGRQLSEVSVRIGGVTAEVLYAGPAPGLVSGALQVNARIPQEVEAGNQAVEVTVGTARSPSGVVVVVGGTVPAPGTGAQIEARLQELRHERAVPPLSEIPTDRDRVPADWLGVISWNIQVGATAIGSPRPMMVSRALSTLFSGSYQLLSAQEVPSSDSAEVLTTLLPPVLSGWGTPFIDTTDSMDNGIWNQTTLRIDDYFPLFITNRQDSSGRWITDATRALHPPVVAHVAVDDFDFTFIGVHLTYADGDTSQSAREMENVMDYLDTYFRTPSHDPDVVICGDFNTPSMLSGQTGRGGITLDSVLAGDARFQAGERRFAVTVHDPTSRNSTTGAPVTNYDHCVVSADVLEEFVQARRVDTNILTDDPEDPEQRLTSDHFPVVAFFKTRGKGISLDLSSTVRP